jgi:hypothetical protein
MICIKEGDAVKRGNEQEGVAGDDERSSTQPHQKDGLDLTELCSEHDPRVKAGASEEAASQAAEVLHVRWNHGELLSLL